MQLNKYKYMQPSPADVFSPYMQSFATGIPAQKTSTANLLLWGQTFAVGMQ